MIWMLLTPALVRRKRLKNLLKSRQKHQPLLLQNLLTYQLRLHLHLSKKRHLLRPLLLLPKSQLRKKKK